MQTKLFKPEISQLGERKMAFVLSTASVDRDQDTIDPAGWDLRSYLRNPIVLWQHDASQLPIARATRMWSDARGLNSELEFPPEGLHPFADQVCALVKAGFLNACSVGFIPITEVPDLRGPGKKITAQELLEFSIVTVPSNRDALVLQRGMDTAAARKWFSNSEVELDLPSIFKSIKSEEIEIDLVALSRSIEDEIEIDPTFLALAFEQVVPEIRAAFRAELKTRARIATHEAINLLTGRLP